jgi:hypothetical protein
LIRLFTGYDRREAHGWHTFVESLIDQEDDVSLSWLSGNQLDGTNAFTYERFRIMERCNWAGWAIFMDGADMLLRGSLDELWSLRDPKYAVKVVKHDYKTKHPRKYVGTEMESDNSDYPRKNWSSVMLINCGHIAHFQNRVGIREAVESGDGVFLHRFAWLDDEQIGDLPREWNWLVDEAGENDKAKLLHWTAGYPGFKHYENAPMACEWHDQAKTWHSER